MSLPASSARNPVTPPSLLPPFDGCLVYQTPADAYMAVAPFFSIGLEHFLGQQKLSVPQNSYKACVNTEIRWATFNTMTLFHFSSNHPNLDMFLEHMECLITCFIARPCRACQVPQSTINASINRLELSSVEQKQCVEMRHQHHQCHTGVRILYLALPPESALIEYCAAFQTSLRCLHAIVTPQTRLHML